MKLRVPIKILLTLCLVGGVLCFLPGEESYGDSSATISATATVIEPLGLVAQPTEDLHRRFLLYSPRSGHTVCQVSLLAKSSTHDQLNAREFASTSNLPASLVSIPSLSPGDVTSAYLVTVIYTEN